MTAKNTQQPFTTIKFERESGPTKNRRLYAVEKTEYGTFKLFVDDEVLEAKHLFHGTHDKIAADGPLRSSANLDDRFFAYCNDWLFALPDDLCADRIFFLRRCSPESLKRRLCTHLNSNKILSAPVNADQVSLSSEELSIATLLAELDVPIYEIQTKDDQSWIVELLEPRPYTDQEQKRIHGLDNITDTQAAPGERETDKDSYPLRINSIQIIDSEFEKVRYMGSEFTLSEQLKETFRWLIERNAFDLDHAKTKSEIESHLRDKGLIDPQASSFQVSGMFKAKLSELGKVLKAEKVGHVKYRYFIR